MHNELIQNLLEALKVSPDNIPLRIQVAEMMINEKMYAEATEQFQAVLSLQYANSRATAGLAAAYYYQQKYSAAIVAFEQIQPDLKMNDRVLYVKCLIKEGSLQQAVQEYQLLLAEFPDFTDTEIDQALRAPSANEAEDMEEDIDGAYFMEKPAVRFADVGGMEKVKEEISIKIILPMKNPELFRAFGKKSGGGILLYGPPGCGKTYIAKATAGEIDAKFISIGLHDILDMWIGNSEKNLHEIFELARRNKPCVLFFDEADAMGASRGDLKQSSMRQVINQFLAELDGVSSDNEGVLVLAATNAPWSVDPAFRRPGRFDRVIFVAPPDEPARAEILQALLKERPTENADVKKIAAATNEYSGADLAAIVDIATEEKLRESISKGGIQKISTRDLLDAVRKHKPTTLEWFSTARNYALYSNESGLYDDILKYLKIKK